MAPAKEFFNRGRDAYTYALTGKSMQMCAQNGYPPTAGDSLRISGLGFFDE
jgi:hypothetical protein